jgi:hypothetical protein
LADSPLGAGVRRIPATETIDERLNQGRVIVAGVARDRLLAVTESERFKGAGGTSGGVGQFFFGCGMALTGGYLLLNRITVRTGFWHIWGYNGAGLTFIPFLIGVGLLFANGSSKLGWLLAGGSLIALIAGVLANLDVYFAQTSLWNVLIIFVLLAGGVGLVVRSLRPQ